VVARSDTAAFLMVRRYLDRKTPRRLVKKYCAAAGIAPSRLGGRGIGIHSLRKTAINDAIRNNGSTDRCAKRLTVPGRRMRYGHHPLDIP
jgi:hypothetical protein